MTRIGGVISGGNNCLRTYARQYLGAFAYRFNSRFNLAELLRNLLSHAALTAPKRERQIRKWAESRD